MKRNRQNDKLVVKIIENETCKMITWENEKNPARIIRCETCKMITLQNDKLAPQKQKSDRL